MEGPEFYLHRLDICRCGRRRGDHEGAQSQPCPETGCAAFTLAKAYDPRAKSLEVGIPEASDPSDLLPPEERARRTRLAWWASLSNDERLALIGQCCTGCGALDPSCRCGDDS